MERMNARLVWSLESQDLMTEIQCDFRKNLSTLDLLVRFETFIRDAFVQKQFVLAIFFDLEKAYDITWKHGILSDFVIQHSFLFQISSPHLHGWISIRPTY